jgi:conjugal transfer pilus assembly protein TraE
MKFNFVTKRVTNFEYQRNTLLGLTAVLLVLLIIMSLCLFFRSERVIVLPPEVRREFWAEGNRFSPEYLEEMAVYFLHLALDVNQTTLPYNTEMLARYSDAETGNYLRNKYEKDIRKLKQNDASTTFEVKEVTVYPDKNVVRAEGRLNRFMGSKQIGDSQETYEVSFKTYRGRLFFKEIKKVEEDKNAVENQ